MFLGGARTESMSAGRPKALRPEPEAEAEEREGGGGTTSATGRVRVDSVLEDEALVVALTTGGGGTIPVAAARGDLREICEAAAAAEGAGGITSGASAREEL